MSLWELITLINKRSQAETCNQVDVAFAFYRFRTRALDARKPLQDWRYKRGQAEYFNELTPLVQKTRILLQEAFDRNFFSRYTQRSEMKKIPFIPKMQIMLHPNSKRFEDVVFPVVHLVNAEKRYATFDSRANL